MPPKRKKLPSKKPPSRSAKRNRSQESSSPQTPAASAPSQTSVDSASSQTPTASIGLRTSHPLAPIAEQQGIVLREHYPPEMSNERALAYNSGEIARPYDRLQSRISERSQQQSTIGNGLAAMIWFRTDLRIDDNRALSQASQFTQSVSIPLFAIYIISPQDFKAHLTSPARIDFIFKHLELLRTCLDKLDIPLQVVEVANRADVPMRVRDIAMKWGVGHVFANQEYEVDELRRDGKTLDMLRGVCMRLHLCHDTCVVVPGALRSGSGNQYVVYGPWYRKWGRYIGEHPSCIELSPKPGRNHRDARTRLTELFAHNTDVPLQLELDDDWTKEYRDRVRGLFPPGEEEAKERLKKFCDNKIAQYDETRNFPAKAGTAALSPYLAVGSISARTCVKFAMDYQASQKPGHGGAGGIETWISEVAWRDFYRHILAHWPYICMNKPFKPIYSNINWSYSPSDFTAWCEGRTGFPIVDAAMRQLKATGWMHNRCRMIVASFLCKDLLLDWRLGEMWFMSRLIDGDFASNNGGWGFCASVGVDPQPYFRVFNPLLQGERFDPEGEFVREWVPELRGLKGKVCHDPYGRGGGETAARRGYPRGMVDHKERREKVIKMYKEVVGKV